MLSADRYPTQIAGIKATTQEPAGSVDTPSSVRPILVSSKQATSSVVQIEDVSLPAPPRTSKDKQRESPKPAQYASLDRVNSSDSSQDRGKQAVREWSEWVDACANSPGATPKSTRKVKLEPHVRSADCDDRDCCSCPSELDSGDDLFDPRSPPKPSLKGPRKHKEAISNSAFDRFDASTVYTFLNGPTDIRPSVNALLPLKARITTDEIRSVVIELVHSLALFVHSFGQDGDADRRSSESKSWALLALRKGDQIEAIGHGNPLSDLAMPGLDTQTGLSEEDVRYQRQEIDALLQELEDLVAHSNFVAGLLKKGNFPTFALGKSARGPDGRYPYETSPGGRQQAHQEALELLLALEEVLWGKNYPSGDLSELRMPSERSRSSAQRSQGLLDFLADGPEVDADSSKDKNSSIHTSEVEVDFVTSALSMTNA